MVANDDFYGKKTHLNCFQMHTNFEQTKPKPVSLSWNFPAQAGPSYEGSEPSQAGALQFSSWNQADNTDNMNVNKPQIFSPT